MKRSTFILILILINACNPDKSKQIDRKGINFSTNDASELFYKNVRQSDYYVEEKTGTTLKVYRYKKYNKCQPDECRLKPAIVHNWKDNLAYLMLEFSDMQKAEIKDGVSIMSISNEAKRDTFHYENSNIKQQLFFITDIYNEIIKGNKIYYLKDSATISLSLREKEAFRITCADFYRLVNVYKSK